MTTPTTDSLIRRVYADTDLRVLTQKMRTILRGRNAGELIGFDETGRPISCRLTGTTNSGDPVSTPHPREHEAAYLFFGAASQDTVAAAVGTRAEWLAISES